jgi:mannose-6-phosphate isomerase-like protein (cupin superfamily)
MNAKQLAELSPDEREAFHVAGEAKIATHAYKTPEHSTRPKDVEVIVKSDLLKVYVQIVRDGGENNLHYHTNSETNWMVLRGRARFYGINDVLLADLGPQESIFLPGGARYWFEKTGSDDLEILQMVAIDRRDDGRDTRINVDHHKGWMTDAVLQQYIEPAAT